MTTLKATIKGRRLEIDVPSEWPDGTEVEIHPLVCGPNGGGAVLSAAEIATTLAAMDQVEPLEMPPGEQAAWETERRAAKERDKAQFAEQAEKLRRQWE